MIRLAGFWTKVAVMIAVFAAIFLQSDIGTPIVVLGAATWLGTRAHRHGWWGGRWAMSVVFAVWAVVGAIFLVYAATGDDGVDADGVVWWSLSLLWTGTVAVLSPKVPSPWVRSSPPGGELAMGPDQGRS